MYLTRDGCLARKRNLEEVLRHEEEAALEMEVAATVLRIQTNPLLHAAFPVPESVTAWKDLFKADAKRYPILIIIGPSYSGKTEFAHALFKNPLELKVGGLQHMPDKLRQFKREVHDAIIFDDLRDMRWVTNHQDKLQGKYNTVLEFGTTPGGQCAYYKYLFRTPLVVTCNFSTQNLGLLDTDDWLGKAQNRVVLHFDGFPAGGAQAAA